MRLVCAATGLRTGKWWVLAGLLAGVATVGSARASDKPLYQPAPAWVKPAPAIDGTRPTAASPVTLILDRQQQLADIQAARALYPAASGPLSQLAL